MVSEEMPVLYRALILLKSLFFGLKLQIRGIVLA